MYPDGIHIVQMRLRMMTVRRVTLRVTPLIGFKITTVCLAVY